MTTSTTPICASTVLMNAIGLHARPSVQLTRLAKEFDADIALALTQDGPWADAKSIVKIMRLRAPQGARLYFKASGADASRAVASLVELVSCHFGERPARRDHA